MDNYNNFSTPYQTTPISNWYYQPTVTTPVYGQRNLQQYYQPQTNTGYLQQSQPVNNGIIWVQGETAARAYNLPNGTTLPLWDCESQTIYIKSVDANGKPTMTVLDYTERVDNTQKSNQENTPKLEYATKDQIDALSKQFSEVNSKLNELGSYVTKEQFDGVSSNVDDLRNQIENIENRITSFGKPQSSSGNNYRKGNK